MRAHLFIAFQMILQCSALICTAAQLGSPGGWAPFNTVDNRQNNATNGSGSIYGVVKTTDQQPVSEASIEMVVPSGPISTESGPDGSFRFYNVPTGQYQLTVKKGIQTDTQRVTVESGTNWVTFLLPSQQPAGDRSQPTASAAQLAVPSKARHELEKARDALHNNKLTDTIRLIEKALTIWPRFAEALVLRALIERDQHSPELALADAEKAIEYDPNYGKAYLALGSVYNDLGRYNDAVRTLDHGTAIIPTYWAVYFEMSRALLGKGDFGGALRQAEKASILDSSNYPPLHLAKGYAYLGLKNEVSARTELEAYITLEPNTELASYAKNVLDQLQSSSKQWASDSSQSPAGGPATH